MDRVNGENSKELHKEDRRHGEPELPPETEEAKTIVWREGEKDS